MARFKVRVVYDVNGTTSTDNFEVEGERPSLQITLEYGIVKWGNHAVLYGKPYRMERWELDE